MPVEHDTEPIASRVDTLADLVGRDGPLPFVDVLDLAADLADALADRHELGQVHGAVAPESCVARRGEPWLLAPPAVVADVAAAAAPELAAGGAATPAGDVYALGATLLFALTGQDLADDVAAAGDDEGEADGAASDLPEVMQRFLGTVRAALAAEPADRPTALELLATVEGLRPGPTRRRVPLAELPPPPVTAGAAALGAAALVEAAPPVFAAPTPLVPLAEPEPLAPGEAPDGATPVVVGAAAGVVAGTGAVAAGSADAAATTDTAAGADGAAGATGVAGEPVPLLEDGTPVVAVPPAEGRKRRLPALLLAAAAVALVFFLGMNLGKRGNEPQGDQLATTAPTGTSIVVVTVEQTTTIPELFEPPPPVTAISTTTTTRPTTTVPPTTLPTTTTTTIPVTTTQPGQPTIWVTVDMERFVTCPLCPTNIRSSPSLFGQVIATAPHGSLLQAACFTSGDLASDGNFSSNQWLKIVGPTVQGWVPITTVGRSTFGLPTCPDPPLVTTTTTAPAATTTTSAKP